MTRCSLYLPNKAKPNTGSETAPGDNNKLAAVFMSCIVSEWAEILWLCTSENDKCLVWWQANVFHAVQSKSLDDCVEWRVRVILVKGLCWELQFG